MCRLRPCLPRSLLRAVAQVIVADADLHSREVPLDRAEILRRLLDRGMWLVKDELYMDSDPPEGGMQETHFDVAWAQHDDLDWLLKETGLPLAELLRVILSRGTRAWLRDKKWSREYGD